MKIQKYKCIINGKENTLKMIKDDTGNLLFLDDLQRELYDIDKILKDTSKPHWERINKVLAKINGDMI